MSQSNFVAGTQYEGGMCDALTNTFIKAAVTESVGDFLNQTEEQVYRSGVAEEKQMIKFSKARTGKDVDHSSFHSLGLSSETEIVEPKGVANLLENKANAASLSYRTSTGALHSLGFFTDNQRCMIFDSNRFTAIGAKKDGSCLFATKVLQNIIQRSAPKDVKVTFAPKK